MTRWFLTSLLILAGCVSSPKAPDSAAMAVNIANLVVNSDGIHYLIVIDFEEQIPPNTHAVIHYENLAQPGQSKALELGSMGKARRLTFQSVSVRQADPEHLYRLDVLLYKTANKAILIGQRQLQLPLIINEKVARLFNIRLL